ncbi:MAG: ABC transporter permease [Candidatus Aminicenantes bacterium]|nr:ABC transporter permease [Candidatus Aminicenantes bacterium]
MFDLEKAIKKWKKTLRKNEALEDGYIAELESHLRDEVDILIRRGTSEEEAFGKAVAEIGKTDDIGAEFHKTHTRRLSGRPPWKPPRFMPELIWNYIKVALRKIRRHKGYSFINISGLAIGMACCFIVFLWVKDELSFDRFHSNAKEIYRVLHNPQDTDIYNPYGSGPLGPALKADYPEIINFTRMFGEANGPLKYRNQVFNGKVRGVDNSFFEMFTFPFIKGDPKNCLSDPRSIVLTEKMAAKLFHEEDPLGKTVGFEWWIGWFDLKVTGVIQDVPSNTHIRFDYLLPFEFVTWSGMSIEDWGIGAYQTYVLLPKNADPSAIQEKIAGIVKRHFPESPYTLYLEPLTRIHLYNFTGGGLITYVYIFSIIGVFILCIACINFMNLSTARSMERAREVGMRKVVGSTRSQLVKQFLGESILLSFISFILAVLLVQAFLPSINSIVDKQLTLPYSSSALLIFLGIAILTGVLSGSYPAIFLSSFRPVTVLKGIVRSGSQNIRLRKLLVIGQFIVSIALIIGTIIIYKQLVYMRTMDMGINKSHVINMELRGNLRNQYGTIKTELLRNPDILVVSATNGSFSKRFGSDSIGWEGKPEDKRIFMSIHSVDFDYQKIFDIKMTQGRYFSRDYPTDRSDGIIVNETAAKIMGMESPIGKRISCSIPFSSQKSGTIIGVAKDFHFRSLHEKIDPLVLVIAPGWFTDAYIRMKPENVPETLGFIEKTIKKFAPDFPFEYSFLDEDIDNLYKTEQRIGNLVRYGTFLAIFIACLGLFGLASFTAEKRTKEIGIRKVLGASISGIVLLLTKEFTKWVILANLIAWPIAYFVMSIWLQNFAYHVNIGIWTFLFSSALALVTALITVSFQAVKTAASNPVDSLRYE